MAKFTQWRSWLPLLPGRRSNRAVIDRLHGEIVAAARDPALFTRFAIDDTFEGRFESVVLHACLVLRRLQALPAPASDMAQDLANALFRHFEIALREVGVGESNVPKRMKTLTEAFLGRSMAYDEALRGRRADLEAALKRNIYAGNKDAKLLAAYVMALEAALAAVPVDVFINGPVPFPLPSAILSEAIP